MNITKKLIAVLIALTSALGITTAIATPVSAWPNDPTVVIQGSGNCNWRYGAKMQSATITVSNGQRGNAYIGGGKYKFTLRNVPRGSGVTVKITWNCGLGRTNNVSTFGVARPAFGNTQTRNLYSCLFCG